MASTYLEVIHDNAQITKPEINVVWSCSFLWKLGDCIDPSNKLKGEDIKILLMTYASVVIPKNLLRKELFISDLSPGRFGLEIDLSK